MSWPGSHLGLYFWNKLIMQTFIKMGHTSCLFSSLWFLFTWKPPSELEWVHPESLVHAGSIAEDSSQNSLKEETKVHEHVLHSLLEDGETSGLANDEIGPLHNDNGDKEGRVTSVFKDLAILVSPFLAIRILEIINGLETNTGEKKLTVGKIDNMRNPT